MNYFHSYRERTTRLMTVEDYREYLRQMDESKGFDYIEPKGTTFMPMNLSDPLSYLEQAKCAVKGLRRETGKQHLQYVQVMKLITFRDSYYLTLKMRDGQVEQVYRAKVDYKERKGGFVGKDPYLSYFEVVEPNHHHHPVGEADKLSAEVTKLASSSSEAVMNSNRVVPTYSGLRLMTVEEYQDYLRQLEESKGFDASIPEGTIIFIQLYHHNFKPDPWCQRIVDFAVQQLQQKTGKPLQFVEVMKLNLSHGVSHGESTSYYFTLKMRDEEGELDETVYYRAKVDIPQHQLDVMELTYFEEIPITLAYSKANLSFPDTNEKHWSWSSSSPSTDEDQNSSKPTEIEDFIQRFNACQQQQSEIEEEDDIDIPNYDEILRSTETDDEVEDMILDGYNTCPVDGYRFLNAKEQREYRRQVDESEGFDVTIPAGTLVEFCDSVQPVTNIDESYMERANFTVEELRRKTGKSFELIEVMKLNLQCTGFLTHYFTLKLRERDQEKVYRAKLNIPIGRFHMRELSYYKDITENPGATGTIGKGKGIWYR